MAKYVYPAIFEPDEENGGFCVHFPDVSGAFTQGDNLAEAMEMAQDSLCLMLYEYEQDGTPILPPTPINSLKVSEGAIASLISCDTDYYKSYFSDGQINKTVAIPEKLSVQAEKAGINFSNVLRVSLEQILENQSVH
jgi:predicted RNase H-like HicB family nuclease